MTDAYHTVGFTGSRYGMTIAQHDRTLYYLGILFRQGSVFRHGDCLGSDQQAADVASKIGYRVIGHPPINQSARAFFASDDDEMPARDYLMRDRDIVDASGIILATPNANGEQPHGGTWYTIRYARSTHTPLIVFGPSGHVIESTVPNVQVTLPARPY